MSQTSDINDLRRQLAHTDTVIAELRDVVANFRKQAEAQQAHIHRLVKMSFGRGGVRVEGPTLFDGLDAESDPTPAVVAEAVPEAGAPGRMKRTCPVK